MSFASQREQSRWKSPWERGSQASAVKPDVSKILRKTLVAWTARRENALQGKTSPEAGLFEADVRTLLEQSACRKAISRISRRRSSVTEADVEAAIVAVCVEILWERCRRLPSLYACSVAARFRGLLRFPLEVIKLNLRPVEEEQEILVPMSLFFLDSLRTCKADPNFFRTGCASEKRLAVRPFGWSPAHDPFETLLSLLILRQAGKVFRPNAFIDSPFGYYLRSAGLATIVEVEQSVCEVCRKEYFQRSLAGRCPECGGQIKRRGSKRLLSTRYVEGVLRQAAAGEEVLSPGQAMLARTATEVAARRYELDMTRRQQPERERRWHVLLERTLELWHKTMHRDPPNPCEMAVLLRLAGLEVVSAPLALRLPRESWLRQIAINLLERSVRRDPILRWAATHMQEICRTRGVRKEVRLTAAYVGKIVFRFRRSIFRADQE